ncbi:condensation domain-containing protein [Iningainema tapete]|uniref:Carrier domain-containing protein n=1 Tax=Iningainema tapete BLCC-T55 TaxID=2748662 RepID=A0A8J6XQ09_9CYAN|nr:condensation domain-containing protein [Iningainema tapete]MBD2777372.1 hypothetical protein [Iningainema tapete BLCC-T55]
MKYPFSEITNDNDLSQNHSEKTPSDFWKAVRTNIKLKHQTPIIKPVSRDGNLPLSFGQERLWLFDQLQPGSSIHNMRAAYRLQGLLNIAALEQSFVEIARRHEILRTTFPVIDGQPVQVISKDIALKLPVVELQELPTSQQEIKVQQLITEESDQSFDLASGPLWRVKLLRLAEEEHVLLRTVHHIIFDGWSYGVFMREVAVLYEAFSTGSPSLLPELPIQYADFAQSQRQWLQGEMLESHLDYWKQQLSGSVPTLELPIDNLRPSVPTYRGASQSLVLSETLTKAVKALSHQEGVSLFVTLLTAFKSLLYQYTGQKDMIVCSSVAGRHRVETKKLIGYFNNLVVMRTDLSGNPSFRELMSRVSRVSLGAYQHQELPFQKLADFPNLVRTPLHRGMFVLQNTPPQPLELADIAVSHLDVGTEVANFDLFLSMEEKGEGLRGVLYYKTNLFNSTTITSMLENFQILLDFVVQSDRHLSDLPLLASEKLPQLINTLGAPEQNTQNSEDSFVVVTQDELELQLIKIWEKVLGIQPIRARDNFFELGGHSLAAVRLFTEIEKTFGKNLPLATLFQAATVAELAQIIRQKDWLAPWSSLVAIQPHGSQPPLFYIHPVGGNLLVYRDLALSLGCDQPVYGLQAKGLDGKFVPITNIMEMADHYITQIRSIQPHGPYFLAGLSSGGMVAWEMAVQFVAQGEKVAMLALFDTPGSGYPKLLPPIPRFFSVLNWVVLDFLSMPITLLAKLKQLGVKYTLAKILGRWGMFSLLDEDNQIQYLNVQSQMRRSIDGYKSNSSQGNFWKKWLNFFTIFLLKNSSKSYYANTFAGGLYYDAISYLPTALQKVQQANRQAGESYTPPIYPGHVILFRASERPPGIYRDPQLGWGGMAEGGMEIYEIPGDHTSIMKSPLLAAQLRACLEIAHKGEV